MTPTRLRLNALVFASVLIFAPSSNAFDSPLSDTAVREAYFLGQRHDDSLGKLLDKYVLYLQPPRTGPYIQSVSFLPHMRSPRFIPVSRSASIAHNKLNSITSKIQK